MYPDFLIAGKYVTLYGICIAIGVVVCIILLRLLGKKIKVNPKFLEYTEMLAYISIIVGFLGAALWQAFYNFLSNPSDGFHPSLDNITFIGGLIFGVGTFIIIYNIQRKKLTGRITDILPIAPCCITVAHGFGRIGCNFAGCCYGKVVPEGKWYSWIAVNMYHTDHVFPAVFQSYQEEDPYTGGNGQKEQTGTDKMAHAVVRRNKRNKDRSEGRIFP